MGALGVASTHSASAAVAIGVLLTGVALLIGRSGRDKASIAVALLAVVLGSLIVWEYN